MTDISLHFVKDTEHDHR